VATRVEILSGEIEFVGGGFVVELCFEGCFLKVEEASPFSFEEIEDLAGDPLTSFVPASTFRFFFGGAVDFSCSCATLESDDDLVFEAAFNSVPGFSMRA